MDKSLSSRIIQDVTIYRNVNGVDENWVGKSYYIGELKTKRTTYKIVLAEFAYLLTALTAIIETVVSGAKVLLSKLFADFILDAEKIDEKIKSRYQPLFQDHRKREWINIQSSSFVILWDFADLFLNIWIIDLFVYENMAKACAETKNLWKIPENYKKIIKEEQQPPSSPQLPKNCRSLSSDIVSFLTSFRNPNGSEENWKSLCFYEKESPKSFKVIIAEIGYIVTTLIAMIETIANLYLFAIAALFCSLNKENKDLGNHFERIKENLKSSAFAMAWSFTNIFLNLCANDLITYEKVAIACAKSGNLFLLPDNTDEILAQEKSEDH